MRFFTKLSIFLLVLFSVLFILPSPVSAFCGDGSCDSGEDDWCSDCDGGYDPGPFCGDGFCDSNELGWCSDCEGVPYCGDNVCDANENQYSCPNDCEIAPFCGDENCDSNELGWCSDCIGVPYCGDGFCDANENQYSCPNDCYVPEPLPPCTSSDWTCTAWQPSVCPSSQIQTRTCSPNAGCDPFNSNSVKPSETQTCTYIPPCTDADKDGYYIQSGCGTALDCNDNNAAINPGAVEVCDGLDNDCNSLIDEGGVCFVPPPVVCTDSDQDGFFAESNCGTALDCNDNNAAINPGAVEVCDGLDNDCNSLIDEGGVCFVPPPEPQNNAPQIVNFIFPSEVKNNNEVTVTVTAHDVDGNLDRITLQTPFETLVQSCIGSFTDCTRTFKFMITEAFSKVFNIIATAFDNAGLSDSKTGTIRIEDKVVPKPILEPKKKEPSVSTGKFSVSRLILEPECVAPGDELLLFASIKNNGDKELKDVKIAATVVEGIPVRDTSGPFTIKERSSASRTLFFDIPSDAKQGIYYMKVAVDSSSDSTAKYRIFEVDNNC